MSADRHITSHTLCNERIAELEAELAAMKGRRCSDCEHVPDDTCNRWRGEKDLNWHCSEWEART